jgi:hypothetical protein
MFAAILAQVSPPSIPPDLAIVLAVVGTIITVVTGVAVTLNSVAQFQKTNLEKLKLRRELDIESKSEAKIPDRIFSGWKMWIVSTVAQIMMFASLFITMYSGGPLTLYSVGFMIVAGIGVLQSTLNMFASSFANLIISATKFQDTSIKAQLATLDSLDTSFKLQKHVSDTQDKMIDNMGLMAKTLHGMAETDILRDRAAALVERAKKIEAEKPALPASAETDQA